MIQINPGFTGRFPAVLHFEDWASDALSDLVVSQLLKGPPPDPPFELDDCPAIKAFLRGAFDALRARSPAHFSNARDADQMRKLVKREYSSRCGSRVPFPHVTGALHYSSSFFYVALSFFQFPIFKLPPKFCSRIDLCRQPTTLKAWLATISTGWPSFQRNWTKS